MILSKKTIILQVFETVADRRRMLSKVTPSGKRSKVKRSKKCQVDEGNKRFSMWGCAAFFGGNISGGEKSPDLSILLTLKLLISW